MSAGTYYYWELSLSWEEFSDEVTTTVLPPDCPGEESDLIKAGKYLMIISKQALRDEKLVRKKSSTP